MGEMFDDEVFVFTPKGEVKALPRRRDAARLRLRRAHRRRPPLRRARRSTAASCRCTTALQSGDIVEILTSNRERGPSRDWLTLVRTSRARNKIRQWFAHEQREDLEQKGRDSLHQALPLERAADQKLSSSPLLAAADPRDGLQEGRRLLRRHRRRQGAGRAGRQQGAAAAQDDRGGRGAVARDAAGARAPASARRRQYGVVVDGTTDPNVLVRMAQVLHAGAGRRDHGLHLGRPRHHDPPRATAPTCARSCARPSASAPVELGRRGAVSRSASRSRSTAGIARACSRTSARTFAENGSQHRRVRRRHAGRMATTGTSSRSATCKELKSRALGAAQHRVGVRRLPRHAARRPGRLTRARPGVRRSGQDVRGRLRGGPRHHFDIEEGEAFGLLGPNGAGKTTTMRMLGTLLPPTGGPGDGRGARRRARARRGAPRDRLRDAGGAASRATRPGASTCMMGRLYGLSRARRVRAPTSCSMLFGLEDAADRQVRTYSGGMRRRHRPGLRARAPAAAAVPRRAHDRASIRPRARPLGRGSGRLQAEGVSLFLHDALPRGGRSPLRPARDRRPWRDRRPRARPDELKAEVGADVVTIGVGERQAEAAGGVLASLGRRANRGGRVAASRSS